MTEDDKFRINLIFCEDVIERDIAAGVPQKDVALRYAMAMKSEADGAYKSDWRAINGAILAFGSLVQPEFNEVMTNSIAVVCSRWLHGAEYDDVRDEVYAMLESPEMRALGKRVRHVHERASA